MALVTRLINSWFKHPEKTPSNNLVENHPSNWSKLPPEIQEKILDFVGDPTRTALVSKDFRELSNHAYTVLVQQYASHPALSVLPIPSPELLLPSKKVQIIYLSVIQDAMDIGIDLKTVEPQLPGLAPLRLQQIRELTLRWLDKACFYRAVFNIINPQLAEPFDMMTHYDIIDSSEKRLKAYPGMFAAFHGDLDLASLDLTHLPSQMSYLKGVTLLNLDNNKLTVLPPEMKTLSRLLYLSLKGNNLSPENVKDICKAIPGLQTVVIDSQQPALIEMFKKEKFPHLNVIVTQILREEEPL